MAPEYFIVGNPQTGDLEICALTTGARAPHTPTFDRTGFPAAQRLADALNAAFNAGVLQGNRTRRGRL